MTNLDHWTEQIHGLAIAIRARWPKLAEDLADITHLADQTAHALPRAMAVTDPGDGLRSPSLTPGGQSAGSHSDPTATTALAHRDGRTEVALATSTSHRILVLEELRLALSTEDEGERRRHIHDARTHATHALSALHRLLPATNTIRRLTPTGDPGCASCHRIGVYSPTRIGPRGATANCRKCEDWLRETGRLPPLGILEAWRDGRRLTTAIVTQAEAAERWRNKRKRKRAG